MSLPQSASHHKLSAWLLSFILLLTVSAFSNFIGSNKANTRAGHELLITTSVSRKKGITYQRARQSLMEFNFYQSLIDELTVCSSYYRSASIQAIRNLHQSCNSILLQAYITFMLHAPRSADLVILLNRG